MKHRLAGSRVRSFPNGSTRSAGGKMVYQFESDIKVDYEILMAELGK